jgi:hypothetical protein
VCLQTLIQAQELDQLPQTQQNPILLTSFWRIWRPSERAEKKGKSLARLYPHLVLFYLLWFLRCTA